VCSHFLQRRKHLVLSSDFLKSGAKFAGRCSMLSHQALLSHRMNEGIRCSDPVHFGHAQELRARVEREHAFARTTGILDPSVYEGHEILMNVRSTIHVDRQDPKKSFAGMAALGYHRGGYLVLPQLGLRIRLEPGDFVLIRGRMLQHFVEDWEGGQRISIPYFTHSSVWRMMKMGHLVGVEEIPDEEEEEDDEEEDDEA
jgi:hypothetical protein